MANADDMVFMTRSRREIEKTFKSLEEMATEYGLTINENTTKYMVMRDNDEGENVEIAMSGEGNRKYIIEKVE